MRIYEIIDIGDGARHWVGVIDLPTGEQITKAPLGFREAGVNAIWRGNDFLLRVRTGNASSSDLLTGRFRGRDDSGAPVILGSLSCSLPD